MCAKTLGHAAQSPGPLGRRGEFSASWDWDLPMEGCLVAPGWAGLDRRLGWQGLSLGAAMEGAAAGLQQGRAGQCAQAWTPPPFCVLWLPPTCLRASMRMVRGWRRKEGGRVLTSLGSHCRVIFERCGRRSLVCAAGQAVIPQGLELPRRP